MSKGKILLKRLESAIRQYRGREYPPHWHSRDVARLWNVNHHLFYSLVAATADTRDNWFAIEYRNAALDPHYITRGAERVPENAERPLYIPGSGHWTDRYMPANIEDVLPSLSATLDEAVQETNAESRVPERPKPTAADLVSQATFKAWRNRIKREEFERMAGQMRMYEERPPEVQPAPITDWDQYSTSETNISNSSSNYTVSFGAAKKESQAENRAYRLMPERAQYKSISDKMKTEYWEKVKATKKEFKTAEEASKILQAVKKELIPDIDADTPYERYKAIIQRYEKKAKDDPNTP